MKHILFLIFILLPILSFSQDTTYIKLDTSSLFINHALTEVVLDNFVTDACKYGLDSLEVTNHIKSLDGIYIDRLDSSKFGVTVYIMDTLSPTGMRGIILIDKSLINNYSIFQITIYHELGHWFGLKHNRRGIMLENSDNVYKTLDKWERNVGRLMKEIKKGNYSYPSDIK